MRKLYCYVDESGQDAGSKFFVVVAVISRLEQESLRGQLKDVEHAAGTHALKWHKTSHRRRMEYLRLVLERNIASGCVYTAHYQKPIPYFFPMLDLLKKSIVQEAQESYRARLYVDGIDRRKATELTNALRAVGIPLHFVRSIRDESEPIIRLADMWAGCIRSALLDGSSDGCQRLLNRAIQSGSIVDMTPK